MWISRGQTGDQTCVHWTGLGGDPGKQTERAQGRRGKEEKQHGDLEVNTDYTIRLTKGHMGTVYFQMGGQPVQWVTQMWVR